MPEIKDIPEELLLEPVPETVEKKVSVKSLESFQRELKDRFMLFLEKQNLSQNANVEIKDDTHDVAVTVIDEQAFGAVPKTQLAYIGFDFPEKVFIAKGDIGEKFIDSLDKRFEVQEGNAGWFVELKK